LFPPDDGMARRIKKLPFDQIFKENPDPNNPRESLIDRNLKATMEKENWGEIFASMLIERYNNNGANFETPKVIKDKSKALMAKNDITLQFIMETYTEDETENKKIKIDVSEMYQLFRGWCQNKGEKKVPKSTEFQDWIDIKYVKYIVHKNNKKYIKGILGETKIMENEEDDDKPSSSSNSKKPLF
jgi:phage/plasmid-associated DNA primase